MSNASGNDALSGDGALLLDCIFLFLTDPVHLILEGSPYGLRLREAAREEFFYLLLLLFLWVPMQPDENPKLDRLLDRWHRHVLTGRVRRPCASQVPSAGVVD